MSRFLDRAWGFVAAPASPRPLAWFRIGLALVLLAEAVLLSGHLLELYGASGLVQWPISDPLLVRTAPRVAWLADALAPLGVGPDACLVGVFVTYCAGLLALLLGWRARAAAVVAWLTQLTLARTGAANGYGLDAFATIGLFYCVWMPVGHTCSLDRLAGRVTGAPSEAARLGLRVLQLHLCIVYLASGLEKAVGEQWWNGEAIWRALMCPGFGQFDFTWLANAPWLARLVCWGTLLLEVGYAFLVWPRATRRAWALATLGLHAGIAVTMGLWAFSAVMAVFTTSAFLVESEPRSQAAGHVGKEKDEGAPAAARAA
jgi:hypothetical protein